MAESVGDIESVTIRAQVEVAWVSSFQFRAASRDLRDLGEFRTGIDPKSAHFILVTIGQVKAGASSVEAGLLRISAHGKVTQDLIGRGIDDSGEVTVLVQNDGVRVGRDS